MGPERPERLPSQSAEIESLLERVRKQQLSEQDFGLLERLLRLLLSVARLLEQKQTSLARLRRLLFGSPPEPPSAPPKTIGTEPLTKLIDSANRKSVESKELTGKENKN